MCASVEDIYIACAVKIQTYDQFLAKYGLTDEEVMYMGDDIPDLEIMRRVGCPVCPTCPRQMGDERQSLRLVNLATDYTTKGLCREKSLTPKVRCKK